MSQVEARGRWTLLLVWLAACGQPKPSESAPSAQRDVAPAPREPVPAVEPLAVEPTPEAGAGGAEPPACDANAALSPLAKAAFEGEAELARVLVVDAERDASVAASCGATPLMLAISPYTEAPGATSSEVRERKQGKLDAAGLFLARCFNVSGADAQGLTALHVVVNAPYNEHVTARLLQRMLECDVPPDAKTREGVTPLMLAVQAKRKKLVRLLLDAGADVNLTSAAGDSALSLAERANDRELAKTLRKGPTRDAGAER